MRYLLLFITFAALTSIAEIRADTLNGVVLTELELEVTIDQLKNPQTDMEAVEKLVKFSGFFLDGITGLALPPLNPVDHLCKRAADAMHTKTSFSTKLRALEHKDNDVRFWAVRPKMDVVPSFRL